MTAFPIKSALGAIFVALPAPLAASPFGAQLPEMGWNGLLVGMFLGFVLLPIFYNGGFFLVLRERFLLWNSLRSLAIAVVIIAVAPLYLGPNMEPATTWRLLLFFINFDLAISLTGPFLRHFLEPGMLSPRVFRTLGWTMPLAWCATPFGLLAPSNPLFTVVRAAILFCVLVVLITALVQAAKRGSKAVRFHLAGAAPLIAVCTFSLAYNFIYSAPWPSFFQWLFVGVTTEILFTAAGILYRVIQLKRQHDESLLNEQAMTRAAMTDQLTRLPNRRALYDEFGREGARPVKAVAIIDLDRFKAINDEFGHTVGDEVLEAAARALKSDAFAEDAFAARLGGEEFAVLLYGEKPPVLAEQMRLAIADTIEARVDRVERRVTASLGLAHANPGETFADIMKRADLYLYKAKALGRDCQQNDLKGDGMKAAA